MEYSDMLLKHILITSILVHELVLMEPLESKFFEQLFF